MKKFDNPDTCIFGLGNNARGDDGLGWALVERLMHRPCRAQLHCVYQLQVEDARTLAGFRQVLFIDASRLAHPGGWTLEPLLPDPGCTFTTHALPPGAVLAWCQTLYDTCPEAWMLAISGYQWELGQGISARAGGHLDQLYPPV